MVDTRIYELERWKDALTMCYDSIESADTVVGKNKHWRTFYELSKQAQNWGLTSADVNKIVHEHAESREDEE